MDLVTQVASDGFNLLVEHFSLVFYLSVAT
jgi:hypothetical protein